MLLLVAGGMANASRAKVCTTETVGCTCVIGCNDALDLKPNGSFIGHHLNQLTYNCKVFTKAAKLSSLQIRVCIPVHKTNEASLKRLCIVSDAQEGYPLTPLVNPSLLLCT